MFSCIQNGSALCRRLQSLKTLAKNLQQKNLLELKTKCTSKGNDKHEDADSLLNNITSQVLQMITTTFC